MEKEKEIAIHAARTAGAILRDRVGKVENIGYKSAFNIVTEVDKASEQKIIEIIKNAFPDDKIIAEESGLHQSQSSRCWYIDPLDGTTNYAHAYPFFCVSIALGDGDNMQLGVVYNPMSDELFFAQRGKGAFLNDSPIKVSPIDKLKTSLLATGFVADTTGVRTTNMPQFSAITDISHGVRRDGSAALDLSFVACGRLEGYWELKLGAWDLAAGTLIVEEAGGKVTGLGGAKFDLMKGDVVATNGAIHDELLSSLKFNDAACTQKGG